MCLSTATLGERILEKHLSLKLKQRPATKQSSRIKISYFFVPLLSYLAFSSDNRKKYTEKWLECLFQTTIACSSIIWFRLCIASHFVMHNCALLFPKFVFRFLLNVFTLKLWSNPKFLDSKDSNIVLLYVLHIVVFLLLPQRPNPWALFLNVDVDLLVWSSF